MIELIPDPRELGLSMRVETVKDTMRRDEMKVEQVLGAQTGANRPAGTGPATPVLPTQRRG